jgi:hypothetical protein
MSCDTAWIDKTLAPDYITINGSGEIYTRQQMIQCEGPPSEYQTATVSEQNVRVYRDAAVENAVWSAHHRERGDSQSIRITVIWIKNQGRWRPVEEHWSTLVPKPE